MAGRSAVGSRNRRGRSGRRGGVRAASRRARALVGVRHVAVRCPASSPSRGTACDDKAAGLSPCRSTRLGFPIFLGMLPPGPPETASGPDPEGDPSRSPRGDLVGHPFSGRDRHAVGGPGNAGRGKQGHQNPFHNAHKRAATPAVERAAIIFRRLRQWDYGGLSGTPQTVESTLITKQWLKRKMGNS